MPGIINLNCLSVLHAGAALFCVLFHAKQRMAVLFFCKQIVLCYLVFVESETIWLFCIKLQVKGELLFDG